MQNDVLKNKIAPWQERGRWYNLRMTSNGTAWTIDFQNSDPLFTGATMVGTPARYVNVIPTFKIIDIKFIFDDVHSWNDMSSIIEVRMSHTRSNLITMPAPVDYRGGVDVFVFGITE